MDWRMNVLIALAFLGGLLVRNVADKPKSNVRINRKAMCDMCKYLKRIDEDGDRICGKDPFFGSLKMGKGVKYCANFEERGARTESTPE